MGQVMEGGGQRGGRLAELDLMRILGAMAVVMVHVSAMPAAIFDTANATWWTANALNAASRWGNALIIMAAGVILLGRPADKDPFQFVRGRFIRLLPAVVFWTAFYLLLRWTTVGLPPARELGIELLRGVPYYHMWFLYMMLGMYLAIPLLRALVNLPDVRLHYYLLGLCAVLTPAEGLTRVVLDMSHASFLGLFPIYFIYLVGGYLLYRDRPAVPIWVLILMPCVCILLEVVGVVALYPAFGESVFKLMYTNRGPLVMVSTFCVFLLLLRLLETSPRWLLVWHRKGGEALTRVTLGIYVLHPFWIDLLARNGIGPLYASVAPAPLAVPLTALLVFTLSAASSLAIGRIPLLLRLVN